MKRATIINVLSFMLILLWIYTTASKLTNPLEFEHQLNNQVFSRPLARALFYIIPCIELITALALYRKNWQLVGFGLSTILMIVFTGYISLILMGYYDRVPCSCGGVISALGWTSHLVFNIFFTAVAVTGTILTYTERRMEKI